jgi:hypothetical protein
MQEQSQVQEQEQWLSQVHEQSHQQILAARTEGSSAEGPVRVLSFEDPIFPATLWRADFDGSPA